MSNRWYCIAILPQFTEKVKMHLLNQKFQPFFPEIILHQTKLPQPMFKGYAFVQFDVEKDQWLSINSTYGVIKLVPKHQLIPTPVTEGFVEHLLTKNPYPEEELVEWLMKLLEEKAKQDDFYPNQLVTIKKTLDPNSTLSFLEDRQATVLQVREKLLEISFLLTLGQSNAIWVQKSSVTPYESNTAQESGSEHKVSGAAKRAAYRAVAIS